MMPQAILQRIVRAGSQVEVVLLQVVLLEVISAEALA
jgi:hypothetical protein